MASAIQRLKDRSLLEAPPSFLANSTQLEVIMGSVAYGVSDDASDMDVYGFCIPPRDYVFPHMRGEIPGFSTKGPGFNQFQQHHIDDKEAGKQYDVCIYSIVKFFRLCMENNPNMLDALFVPRRCVLYSTGVGELVRENRKLFLSKAAWPKHKGYSFSQLNKLRTKTPKGERARLVEQHGFDTKFGYHVVRLLSQVEQILTTGDLDLEANREQLKAIRRGDWTLEQVEAYFNGKERELEAAYADSKLPWKADENAIKGLLLKCLESNYGSVDEAMRVDSSTKALQDIQAILDRSL